MWSGHDRLSAVSGSGDITFSSSPIIQGSTNQVHKQTKENISLHWANLT